MTYEFIPQDVLSFAKKRQLRRRLICLVLFTALLLLGAYTLSYYRDVFFSAETTNLVFIACLYLILIITVSGFPFALYDRSYIGEIIKVTVSTVPLGKDPLEMKMNNSLIGRKDVDHVLITVRLLGCKKQVLKQVATYTDKHYAKIDEFHEDDIVYYLDGVHHVFLFPQKEKSRRLCVICGLTNLEGETACLHCGHTLFGGTADGIREAMESKDKKIFESY